MKAAHASSTGALHNVTPPITSQTQMTQNVLRVILLAVAIWPGVTGAVAQQQRPTRFWNLTRNTITDFRLAPTGTSDWGPNQCVNDKDGSVDHDERLRITGVPSGTYDAKLTDVTGRVCTMRGIKIEANAIFSIEEKELTSCNR